LLDSLLQEMIKFSTLFIILVFHGRELKGASPVEENSNFAGQTSETSVDDVILDVRQFLARADFGSVVWKLLGGVLGNAVSMFLAYILLKCVAKNSKKTLYIECDKKKLVEYAQRVPAGYGTVKAGNVAVPKKKAGNATNGPVNVGYTPVRYDNGDGTVTEEW